MLAFIENLVLLALGVCGLDKDKYDDTFIIICSVLCAISYLTGVILHAVYYRWVGGGGDGDERKGRRWWWCCRMGMRGRRRGIGVTREVGVCYSPCGAVRVFLGWVERCIRREKGVISIVGRGDGCVDGEGVWGNGEGM